MNSHVYLTALCGEPEVGLIYPKSPSVRELLEQLRRDYPHATLLAAASEGASCTRVVIRIAGVSLEQYLSMNEGRGHITPGLKELIFSDGRELDWERLLQPAEWERPDAQRFPSKATISFR